MCGVGSKRSSHSNAYFYGFHKNKRIVLFDTLLEDYRAATSKTDSDKNTTSASESETQDGSVKAAVETDTDIAIKETENRTDTKQVTYF